jgi:preprotein translocase subunit SecG
MYALLITIHVIASLVLVFVILLQSGRGGGLSEAFGFSATSTFFGASAQTFLQRATSICAIVFLCTSLGLALLSSHQSKSLMDMNRIRSAFPAAQKETMPAQEPAVPAAKTETALQEQAAPAVKTETAPPQQAAPVTTEATGKEAPKAE